MERSWFDRPEPGLIFCYGVEHPYQHRSAKIDIVDLAKNAEQLENNGRNGTPWLSSRIEAEVITNKSKKPSGIELRTRALSALFEEQRIYIKIGAISLISGHMAQPQNPLPTKGAQETLTKTTPR